MAAACPVQDRAEQQRGARQAGWCDGGSPRQPQPDLQRESLRHADRAGDVEAGTVIAKRAPK
ncbi:hypothetical protein CK216_24665 [Mesorhizobium sp. WSM3876]|nr:hypothetical protein CK216_24665 [Mesorhizobium sp. WSM3876]